MRMPSAMGATRAVAACLILAAAAGCSQDGDTIVVAGGVNPADTFPGTRVADGNLADDGQAFSANDRDVLATAWRPNGTTGRGIVLFKTKQEGVSLYQLWASYSDGRTLTPPVELRAADVDFTKDFHFDGPSGGNRGEQLDVEVVVLFLNTATHPNANSRARDGDAVILWRRTDIATGGSDGANVALFASYFDATLAGDAARRFGFDAATGLARRLDNNDGAGVVTGGVTTRQDAAGENVLAHGIVSDGFRARVFFGFAQTLHRNGDPVSFNPVAVFIQTDLGISADDGVSLAGVNDERMFYRVIDIEDADPTRIALLAQGEVPFASAGAPTRETNGGSSTRNLTAAGDFNVSGRAFNTNNNVLIFIQRDGAIPVSPTAFEDRTVVFNRVDPTPADRANPFEPTSTALTAGQFGAPAPLANGILERHQNGFHPNGTFGTDDGLVDQILFFFVASSNTTTAGVTDDPSLFVAQINPTEPFEPWDAATDRVQLSLPDATAADNGDGVDGHTFAEMESATPVNRRAAVTHPERLSRDKRYVAVAYRQSDIVASARRMHLKVATIATNLTPAGGNLPALGVNPTVIVSDAAARSTFDVSALQFQDELDGDELESMRAAAVVSDCPQQSDPSTMFLLFEQSETVTAVTDAEDRLYVRGFRFQGKGVAPALVGAAAVELPGGRADGTFEGDGANGEGELEGALSVQGNRRFGRTVFATDNGLDASGNPRLLVLYVRDQDNDPAVADGDLHLVAAEVNFDTLGEVVQIDSGDPIRDVPDAFTAFTVRTDRSSGGAADASFSGDRVHVLFTERRTNVTSSFALRNRSLDKRARRATPGVGLADEFFPRVASGVAPLAVDVDVDHTPTSVSVAHSGETVAVYFQQDGHVWYNEFTGSSWMLSGGAGAPALVDADGLPPTNGTLTRIGAAPDADMNDLSGGLVLFTRSDLDGNLRLFVRRRH